MYLECELFFFSIQGMGRPLGIQLLPTKHFVPVDNEASITRRKYLLLLLSLSRGSGSFYRPLSVHKSDLVLWEFVQSATPELATAWTKTCYQPTIYPRRKFCRVQHPKDEAKIEWVSWLCRCLFSGVSHWFHPLNFCGYFLKGIPFYAVHLLLSIQLSTLRLPDSTISDIYQQLII